MTHLTYEQALAELQTIVQALQDDAVGIDELAGKVERAAELIRYCRERLRQTETRIDTLFREETGEG